MFGNLFAGADPFLVIIAFALIIIAFYVLYADTSHSPQSKK